MQKWLHTAKSIAIFVCWYLAIDYLVTWLKPYLPEFHSPFPPMTELVFMATIAALAIIFYHLSKWAIGYVRNHRD